MNTKPLAYSTDIALLTKHDSAAALRNLPQTTPTQPVISTLELPQGQNNIPQSEASVPRVNVEDAKTAFDSSEAIIEDVRSPAAFADGHAAGAISIPLGEFEGNIANVPLDKDQWIITYCT